MNTLALFLSYLAFTRTGHSGACLSLAGEEDGARAAGGAAITSHPTLDVAAALEAAAAAPEGVGLACTLPWVLRYLWFLRYDAHATQSPYFRRAAARTVLPG